MTKITESGRWEESVYQIQRGDKVKGGRDGVANIQPQQLANRTQYLKQAIEGLSVGEQPFDNEEKAQAKINDGSITLNARFSVRIENADAWVAEYKNIDGKATPTGRTLPSGELVKKVTDYFHVNEEISNLLLDIVDDDYFSVWRLFDNGAFGTIKSLLSPQGIFLDDLKITHVGDRPGVIYQDIDDFIVEIVSAVGDVAPGALQGHGAFSTQTTHDAWLRLEDVDGFFKDYIDLDGNLLGGGSAAAEFDLVAYDAQNKTYSQSVRDQYNADIQRLVSALNHLLIYSQSLGTQQEGHPALSNEPIDSYDNLMLGDSVRPKSRTAAEFVPVGEAVLKPLKAVVQSGDGAKVLTDAESNALAFNAGNEGEGGAALGNFLRKLWLQNNCLERDPARRFVVSSTGVNGRTIEELSKNANPKLYLRPFHAVQQIKAIADQMGVSYAIAAFIFIQGEWNYNGMRGGVQTKIGYRGKLDTLLLKDMTDDMAYGIAGQKSPPAIFMYQTGGGYTVDTYELGIGMAQWEFCKENANAYLVTPAYPFPDKGGHLTSNGYRWMDMQFAKVMHRVINEGQGWEPLGPIKIIRIGRVIYVLYHVPSPPLQFRPSYVGRVPTIYADKGFRVTDSAGAIPIESVEIVADTIIKITLASVPAGAAKLWYGDKTTHNGNGNVFDSDGFASLANYEYHADSNQAADENIAELVGKPYPLNNASVQFCEPIEIGE
ncbi:Uncharacterised protein [Serratia liquefaciens]|uniref:hypothetical protein n=1 Tax=Serratia liquefaciens TaxID=614 RepID=UPI0021789B4E|nr:hypothetical protein [Serratia liquefaciens]CAI0994166.1 Uncharacterised protein [Serratia liquefaciens]CAI1523081.1 Uncharacterised protein [Serratia liquefaciens]